MASQSKEEREPQWFAYATGLNVGPTMRDRRSAVRVAILCAVVAAVILSLAIVLYIRLDPR